MPTDEHEGDFVGGHHGVGVGDQVVGDRILAFLVDVLGRVDERVEGQVDAGVVLGRLFGGILQAAAVSQELQQLVPRQMRDLVVLQVDVELQPEEGGVDGGEVAVLRAETPERGFGEQFW